jgi:hypothetical protein
MKKSLLDMMKEKRGETFDISSIDFSTALMERVAMNRSTFKSVANAEDILVGFEAEWKSEHFTPEETEWSRIGSNPDDCDLDDARRHDNWDERHFTSEYQEWRDESIEYWTDNNEGEVSDYVEGRMIDDFEDDILDDGDAILEITGGGLEDFYDKIRDEEGWDEDDDDYKDVPLRIMRSFLRANYYGELIDYLQSTYPDEWMDARDSYIDQYADDYDEDEFFDRHRDGLLRYMGMDEYDENDGDITDDMMDRLASSLWTAADIEIKGTSTDYNGSSKADNGYDGYYLETDGGDAELVSPPQPVATTLSDLERILNFIKQDGGATEGNGLHVSVSVKGKSTKDHDPLKILMFLGEEYLTKAFDRESNSYAKQHTGQIKSHKQILELIDKRAELQDPRDLVKMVMNNQVNKLNLDNFVGYLVHTMTSDRYRTFNLQHLVGNSISSNSGGGEYTDADTPYIEFRIMGNEGYENKFETIKDTILRYAYVMKLATDPMAEREEYAKKLFRFFSMLIGESRKAYGKAVAGDVVTAANAKMAMKFAESFTKDFIRGTAIFNLGSRRMNASAAHGYLTRILKNQIEDWMHQKVHETWMIVAVMLKAAEFRPNGVNINDYTAGLKVVFSRMRITSANFNMIANGALITDEYEVDGQKLTEQQFARWVESKAKELKLI